MDDRVPARPAGWDSNDLIVMHGESRLNGQDRSKVNRVIQALNQQSSRQDNRCQETDRGQHQKKARTASPTSAITAILSRNLAQLRVEDLQWLASRIQDELRSRHTRRIPPLVLPLDPAFDEVIDGLAHVGDGCVDDVGDGCVEEVAETRE